MAIQSFADLKTSMGKWLKRPDLAPLFPDFIMLAERNFDRAIKTRSRRETFSVTPSTDIVALPSDWGRVISVRYNDLPLSFYPSSADKCDLVLGYQIHGDHLVLGVPQLGQKLVLKYYTAIEPLSDANTSNWLLEDAPDIYLWGALVEAADYTRDEANQQKWLSRRDSAIQDFIDDDSEAKTPEDQPLRMRAV